MTSNNKIVKRVTPLVLLLLILMPINVLFLRINNISNLNNDVIRDEEDDENTPDNPKSSAVNENTFKINGTVMYPNGTYYIYQQDYLKFYFENSTLYSAVSSVTLTVTGVGITDSAFSQVSSTWTLYEYFNAAFNTYDAVLTFTNNSHEFDINFKIKIMNPAINVIGVWGKDTVYNNFWQEIYEGGVYSTYGYTDFEITVATMNRDAVVERVTLNYTDGVTDYTDVAADPGVIAGMYLNFSYTFSNGTQIDIDPTNTNRWKPRDEMYLFTLDVSDDSESEYYVFEFYVEVKNKAPIITQFDLSSEHVETPTGQTTEVEIVLDATDFEDDLLYYPGSADRVARYTDSPSSVSAIGGCVIDSGSIDDLKEAGEGNEYTLTYTQGASGGALLVDVALNPDINVTTLGGFMVNFSIYDNAALATTAKVEIFDHSGAGSWDLLYSLSSIAGAPWDIVIVHDDDLPGAVSDYIPTENNTITLKFYYNDTSPNPVTVHLDYLGITTNITRRETFSRVILQVWKPGHQTYGEGTAFEIINNWDTTNNVWYTTYEIENIDSNYGTWTFVAQVLDHGEHDYISTKHGVQTILTSSSPKDFYGFVDTDKQFGQAWATKLFSIGIPQQEALKISGNPQYDTSSNPLHDDIVNISVDVEGIESDYLTYKNGSNRILVSGLDLGLNETTLYTSNVITTQDNLYCTVWGSPSPNDLDIAEEGDVYNMTFFGNDGEFLVWVSLDDLNVSSLISFDTSIRIRDNETGVINTAEAQIFDHTNKAWVPLADLTSVSSTFEYLTTDSGTLPNTVADYVPSVNNSISLRFHYDHTAQVSVEIDFITINATVGPTGSKFGINAFPLYNISGSIDDLAANDATSLDIAMNKELGQNLAFHSVMWISTLENRADLTKDNISALYVTIDNWFNTTTGILGVNLEFWDVNHLKWVLLPGSWSNGALNTSAEGNDFIGIVNNAEDLDDIIDFGSTVRMRIRVITAAGVDTDLKIFLDFINVTAEYVYSYTANVRIISKVNGGATTLALTPTKLDTWKMRYWVQVNISALGLYADRFILAFYFKNGNSSLSGITNYRIEPRVFMDVQSQAILNKYVHYYVYAPTEDVVATIKNYTFFAYDPDPTLDKLLSMQTLNPEGLDADSHLCMRSLSPVSSLNLTTILDLKTLALGTPNFLYKFQFRSGIENGLSSFSYLDVQRVSDTNFYRGNYPVPENIEYGVHYVKLYIRTPFGFQLSTNWTEFRVIKPQPIDFKFAFDNGAQVPLDRGQTYGAFEFSFVDYDMGGANPGSWASGRLASSYISIKFQTTNKVGSSVWLDATVGYTSYSAAEYRFRYSVSVVIPLDTDTGPDSKSYYNWTFNVYDWDETNRQQSSYLFYNRTEFVIYNNEPVINNLNVNGSASLSVYRNNDINISFSITDTEDAHADLSVIGLNITGPQGATNLTLTDGDVLHHGNGDRSYLYSLNRTAELGIYFISLIVDDDDGKQITNSTTVKFTSLNNIPVVLAVNYTNYTITGVRRDIDPPVNITVNITDVEDSYTGDYRTNSSSGETPYLLLRHKENSVSIANVAPHLEPYRLNLTLESAGSMANGYIETWKTSISFNFTVNGTGWSEHWYAGNITLEIFVTDKDSGNDDNSYIISELIVLNNAIQPKTTTQIVNENIIMYSQNWYYFANTSAYGTDIKFYVFVDDVEGIDHISIWFILYTGPSLNDLDKGGEQKLDFNPSNWEFQTIQGVPTYVCTLSSTLLTSETLKIQVRKIGAYDTDHSYAPDTGYGDTRVVASAIGIDILISGTPPPPVGDPIVLFVLLAILIVAGVIGVTYGIVRYRKSTGWKRFLD